MRPTGAIIGVSHSSYGHLSGVGSFAAGVGVAHSMHQAATRQIDELLALDQIHRHNLHYLESLVAQYGLDTPLRVQNEIQAEQAELKKVRAELVELEHLLQSSTLHHRLKAGRLAAVNQQVASKKQQVEIRERNISYLDKIVAEHGRHVTLSLHNLIRTEAEQLVSVRKQLAKLNWLAGNLAAKLAAQPAPGFALPVRSARRPEKKPSYCPRTLECLGECAVEQDILCLIVRGNKRWAILSQTASDLLLDFLAFVSTQTSRTPRLLDMPGNKALFFRRLGDTVLNQELQFYSNQEAAGMWDFEFDAGYELVYVCSRPKILGNRFWLPQEINLDSTIKQHVQPARTGEVPWPSSSMLAARFVSEILGETSGSVKTSAIPDRDPLLEELAIHQRNLADLKIRKAKYGIDVPLSTLRQIEDEESAIARLEHLLEEIERGDQAGSLPASGSPARLELPGELPGAPGEKSSPTNPPIGAVRDLLLAAFTHRTLPRFCLDHPHFRPVQDQFSAADGLADQVDKLIEYCATYLLWPELLAAVAQANPNQYALFARRVSAPDLGFDSPDLAPPAA